MLTKLLLIFSFTTSLHASVEVQEHQLVVDGVKQPQLFGAEVQYFRLRGGYGPNVPREKVLALWNRALDRFVEAKMNAISFYIPWDFHEYAEGKFDFTGTADLDRDGQADYPSRDLVTFFKLIEARGIKRIMVRPGPYINAEWGFLGFGAIPNWFHKKYPDSHMKTAFGLRSRLYDYHNPDLLRHTQLWFQQLHAEVLKDRIGEGKPIIFLQLDNETNFQWQSIYNHDFGQSTIGRYQEFLRKSYDDLTRLNSKHQRNWMRWNQIQPPMTPGRNLEEDREWYRFADYSIFSFLAKIRNIWQGLGISEPEIMFTLAESYNAPTNGLLPNFSYRNFRGTTGLMTVNLYPKTFEEKHQPLLNNPFKADLDVKAADAGNDSYFGSKQEWVLGPEIQGGWWRGINVTPEARQQTYLTVLGHGLKAFFIYYFNEGQNWDAEWGYNQIRPLFDELKYERKVSSVATSELDENFWNELQARSDRKILVGFDVRRIMKTDPVHDQELFFDAPLDGEAQPRQHFTNLKRLGERVVFPYQDFLARSLAVHDDVILVKDSVSHQPAPDSSIPSQFAAAEWTGGLLGYMMNADFNPQVLLGDLSSESSFRSAKALVHLDTGFNSVRTLTLIKDFMGRERTVINFLSDDVPRNLGFDIPGTRLDFKDSKVLLTSEAGAIYSTRPIYTYNPETLKDRNCEGILFFQEKPVGYRCKATGGTYVQIGALIFEGFNSGAYAELQKPLELRRFLKSLLPDVETQMSLSEESERTVAFARKDPSKKLLWVTVKTGNKKAQMLTLKVSAKLLSEAFGRAAERYSIKNLLSNMSETISAKDIVKAGFAVDLKSEDSTVFVVEPVSESPHSRRLK